MARDPSPGGGWAVRQGPHWRRGFWAGPSAQPRPEGPPLLPSPAAAGTGAFSQHLTGCHARPGVRQVLQDMATSCTAVSGGQELQPEVGTRNEGLVPCPQAAAPVWPCLLDKVHGRRVGPGRGPHPGALVVQGRLQVGSNYNDYITRT